MDPNEPPQRNPYEPPLVTEMSPEASNFSGLAFSGAVGAAWNIASGRRGELFAVSLAYWLFVGLGIYSYDQLTGEEPTDAEALFFVGFVIVSALAGRFVSLVMTTIYLRLFRSQPITVANVTPSLRVILRTSLLPIFGFGLVCCLAVLILGLWDFEVIDESTMDLLIVVILLAVPLALTILGWAANPYWVDQDAGFLEGLTRGVALMASHPGGTLGTLGLLGVTFASALVCWLGWFAFDVLNVGAFVAAYRVEEKPGHAYLSEKERKFYLNESDEEADPDPW